MFAVIAVILALVAGVLELTGKHLDWVIWLVIIAVALVGAEVAWGWNRGGRYGPRGT